MERPRPLVLVSVIALLVLLAAGGAFLAYDAMQRSELAAALTGTDTLEAYLAEGPAVDTALQERVWAWSQRWPSPVPQDGSFEHEKWFLGDSSVSTAHERRQHEAIRASIEQLTAFLATDRLVVTSRGWLKTDVGSTSWDLLESPRRMLRWSVLNRAYTWYGVEAMRLADPEPVLRTLERLDRAIEPIGLFMDLMQRVRVVEYRDRIYLRLALGGSLTPARSAAWLAEPPLPMDALAQVYRSERLMLAEPIAEDLANGDGELTRRTFGRRRSVLRWARNEFYLRMQGPRDAGRLVQALTKLEQHARGKAPDSIFAEIDTWQADGGPIINLWLADSRAILQSVVTARATQRAMRLAARAVAMGDGARGLPADDAAFRRRLGTAAVLLDTGRFDLGLRYERPAPDRVRIALDPSAALPGPLGGITPSHGSLTPPARIHIAPPSVEIRLPTH